MSSPPLTRETLTVSPALTSDNGIAGIMGLFVMSLPSFAYIERVLTMSVCQKVSRLYVHLSKLARG